MNTSHVFEGLKEILDLASFLAGPERGDSTFRFWRRRHQSRAARDWRSPHRMTYKDCSTSPKFQENYSWHLANRPTSGAWPSA